MEDSKSQMNVSVLFLLKQILEFREKDQMLKTLFLKKYVSITVAIWDVEKLELYFGQYVYDRENKQWIIYFQLAID